MKVLAVDDEKLTLLNLVNCIQEAIPDAIVYSFRKYSEVVQFVETNKIDIAFLDIELRGGENGVSLGKLLMEKNPNINIIFCTGYSNYGLEAVQMRCSGYITKPITAEQIRQEMEHLRFPLAEAEEEKKIEVKCFGNFEVYYNGLPMTFTSAKTKELLAYLIDRHGSLCTNREIMSILWEDGQLHNSYMKKIRAELQKRFSENGLEDVLIVRHGSMGINVNKISCDYYDYLEGKNNSYRGEYMSQYPWSEYTNIKA